MKIRAVRNFMMIEETRVEILRGKSQRSPGVFGTNLGEPRDFQVCLESPVETPEIHPLGFSLIFPYTGGYDGLNCSYC